jgi:hypothetical protein
VDTLAVINWAFAELDEAVRLDFLSWEVVPGFINGEVVCCAILKGTEIHFSITEPWRKRAIQRHRARAFLKPLLEKKTYLTTRVVNTDPIKRRFIERLGFKPTWTDQTFTYFLLGKLPFEKEYS